jgi:hypothetical protein
MVIAINIAMIIVDDNNYYYRYLNLYLDPYP